MAKAKAPVDPLLESLAPSAAKKGPGSGGGGEGGGKPGETTAGNNLSVPAIFPVLAPTLRGIQGQFTFTTPAEPTEPVDPAYVYFAQGVADNEWQAGSITANANAEDPIAVDIVNIGDALESAPIKKGRNIRLELSLFEEIADVTDTPDNPDDDTLTGFAMTLLGGAKGKSKPSKTGPTESQGARLPVDDWKGSAVTGTVSEDTTEAGITYETDYASVYASDGSTTEEEKGDSYIKLVIQKVTGLEPQYAADGSATPGVNDHADFLTGLTWNGSQWVDAIQKDSITVGNNISNVAFGPELTVSGTFNVGASGKPWQFSENGTYLITFALENGTPLIFDNTTVVRNDDPLLLGFQPTELTEGRLTQVVPDGLMGSGGEDLHNGLLALLVGVPSKVGGGGESTLSSLL